MQNVVGVTCVNFWGKLHKHSAHVKRTIKYLTYIVYKRVVRKNTHLIKARFG